MYPASFLGLPTTAESTTITVKVTDSVGGIATKQLSIMISLAGVVPVSITTISPQPAGVVGATYNLSLAATGGTGTRMWSVSAGSLPTGPTLNSSTGAISGTPSVQETATFTVQVADSGSPQQSDQKQFSLTINPVSGGGGGGGQLSVSNAPASVGGTFVVDPTYTQTYTYQYANPPITIQAIGWGEVSSNSHYESLSIGFDQSSGQLTAEGGVAFWTWDYGASGVVSNIWYCYQINSDCGISVDTATRTLTFNNSVLSTVDNTSTITLNGTLSYPVATAQ